MAKTLLVVDDEKAILFAMKRYFKSCGFDVDIALDKKEAEECLSQKQYSVIIVDLRLSGFGGAEGLEVARIAKAQCPKIKIVVLTAYGTSEVEKEAREIGVDSFLQKPKPLPDVAQIVFGLLASGPDDTDAVITPITAVKKKTGKR